ALDKAAPRLLEPILKMEVVTPDDYVGELVGELNSLRGVISGIKGEDGVFTVDASVPAARIFGFPNFLQHLTQGRGTYSAQFSHYEQVFDGTDDDPLWPEAASAALRA
ncbi:MAG: hypothetical protein HKN28_19155, partial [Alphaproteobacteria bacterium]|nr:hypothetical protein [Alphaproteobacteria bacterium]